MCSSLREIDSNKEVCELGVEGKKNMEKRGQSHGCLPFPPHLLEVCSRRTFQRSDRSESGVEKNEFVSF